MSTKRYQQHHDALVQIADLLRSPVVHPGSLELERRYVQSGHLTRLIHSYASVAADELRPQSVGVFGASAVEGFLVTRLFPSARVSLYGTPETLVYLSREDYRFDRDRTSVEARASETGAERITVHRVDLDSNVLPLESGTLDLAVCFETIEHLRRDPLGFLLEVRRVLAANGRFYLSTPNLSSRKALLRGLDLETPMFFPPFGPPPYGLIHAHEFGVLELICILERAGFTLNSVESFDHADSARQTHDEAWRVGENVSDEARSLLARVRSDAGFTEPAGIRAQLDELKRDPLRGDYLFLGAVASGSADPRRREPLYVSAW